MPKRRNKKWVASVLVLSILMSCLTANVYAADIAEIEGGVILKEIYNTSLNNEENVNKIGVQITNEGELAIQSLYLTDVMETNAQYGQYYGGSYINDGELVVLLTNVDHKIKSFVGNSIRIQPSYEKCNVSLQELKSIKETIVNFCQNYSPEQNSDITEMVSSISSVGTYVDQNKIFVKIVGCDEEKITLFKQCIIDSEHVIFQNTEGLHNTSGQLKSGQAIELRSGAPYGTNFCSLGFRCRRLVSTGNYEMGFVTCGHNNRVSWMAYNASGDDIGMVYARNYSNNGSVDASFVCVDGMGYTCSNSMFYSGSTYTTTVSNVSTGVTVYMEGSTTGRTSGRITSTDAMMFTGDGIMLVNLYEAAYASATGDSGGIVYRTSGTSNAVVGIQKGGGTTGGQAYSYIVKVNNILNALNVVFY